MSHRESARTPRADPVQTRRGGSGGKKRQFRAGPNPSSERIKQAQPGRRGRADTSGKENRRQRIRAFLPRHSRRKIFQFPEDSASRKLRIGLRSGVGCRNLRLQGGIWPLISSCAEAATIHTGTPCVAAPPRAVYGSCGKRGRWEEERGRNKFKKKERGGGGRGRTAAVANPREHRMAICHPVF